MKITLELDEEQLGILLGSLERGFEITSDQVRGQAALEAALEVAQRHWHPDEAGFEYEVAKMAPVYRQLLKHWKGPAVGIGEVYMTDQRDEFAGALDVARSAER